MPCAACRDVAVEGGRNRKTQASWTCEKWGDSRVALL